MAYVHKGDFTALRDITANRKLTVNGQTFSVYAGDPNSIVTEPEGSLLWDSTNKKWWRNTGTNVWVSDTDRITTIEDKYVRVTRFASVSNDSGTVTIAANNTVILDDFGGGLDAVVSSISNGKPSFESPRTVGGDIVSTTFDSGGNYVLSGTPSTTPVAIIYRTRIALKNFDATDADIVGEYDIENEPKYRRVNVTSAMSPYTATSIQNTIYAVDLTGGSVVFNLPEISSAIEGQSCSIYIELISGTNSLTVNTFGSQTIRGQTSQILKTLRDGFRLVAHTYITHHWDALEWNRTDEIVYNAGNSGVTTITKLQGLLDFSLSSGQVSGCVITSNGNGTIAVSDGEWKLRTSDSPTADCRVYKVSANASLTPTNLATSYLVVNYNGGSPSWTIESDITSVACQSKCVQAVLYRNGNTIHWLYLGNYSTDFTGAYAKAKSVTSWLEYGSGLAVSNPAALKLAVTAGSLYQGTIRFATPAFNTAGTDTMDLYYRDGLGGWTLVLDQTDLNSTSYDDGDGTLAALSANRYANWWIFTLVDNPSKLVAVYPQIQHATIANARAESIPAVLPPWAAKYSIGKLIAKVTVQQGQATVVEIASPFVTQFTSTNPVSHNDLSGLQGGAVNDYYHLTQAQHTIATQAASGSVAGYITTGTQTIAGEKTFSSLLTVNRNASTNASPANTVVHAIGADAVVSRFNIDSFGASTLQQSRHSDGTAASKTNTKSGNVLYKLQSFGYGATGYLANESVSMRVEALEAFSDTASGAKAVWAITPTSSNTPADVFTILPTGVEVVGTGKFTGNVTLDSASSISLDYKTSGVTKTLTGLVASPGDGISGSSAGDYFMRVNAKDFIFSTDNGTSNRFRIASTGDVWVGSSTATKASVILHTDTIARQAGYNWYVNSQAANSIFLDTQGTLGKLRFGRYSALGLFVDAPIEIYNDDGSVVMPNISKQSLGSNINAATEKTTPVDADMVGLMDSAAGNILKKLSWTNIKAKLYDFIRTGATTAPATGFIGEYLTANGNSAQTVTDTLTNAVSISLTAGTWEVWATGTPSPNGSYVESNYASTYITVGASVGSIIGLDWAIFDVLSANRISNTLMTKKVITIASTTTIKVQSKARFSAGAVTWYEAVSAVRVA